MYNSNCPVCGASCEWVTDRNAVPHDCTRWDFHRDGFKNKPGMVWQVYSPENKTEYPIKFWREADANRVLKELGGWEKGWMVTAVILRIGTE